MFCFFFRLGGVSQSAAKHTTYIHIPSVIFVPVFSYPTQFSPVSAISYSTQFLPAKAVMCNAKAAIIAMKRRQYAVCQPDNVILRSKPVYLHSLF